MFTTGKRQKYVYGLVVLLIAAVCFVSGYYYSALSLQRDLKKTVADNNVQLVNQKIDFNLFWKVWNSLKQSYVNQPISDQQLFYGAISGVANATEDPYTVFLNPEQTKSFSSDINGQFEGIGAEIGVKDAQIIIIAPLKGSPAEQAGLKSGDAVIRIDGTDTVNLSVDKAVNLIRGPKDSTVTLTIYRKGADNVQDIAIKRAEIKIPSVTYTLKEQSGKRIAVVELSHFNQGSAAEFNTIAQQIVLDVPDGMILDLRNNPGGLLDECVNIASQFIPTGVIVKERLHDNSEQIINSTGSGTLANISNLVVLINEGSASASEILAGALQDYHKATIIGTTSFGKGSVQNYQEFSDGSSLKMTIAKWFTPLDHAIDRTGIKPDIEVERKAKDYKAKRDPQFDRAMQELTK